MKKVILFLSIIAAASLISCGEKTPDPLKVNFGIVTASKLISRQAPDRNAKTLTTYSFGEVIRISAASEKDDEIGGLKARWYKDVKSGGWLFGGYMITGISAPGSPTAFKAERVRCNSPCGGNSCSYLFSAALAGDYYSAPEVFDDYCAGPPDATGIPCTGIVIGKYKLTENGAVFYKPEKTGIYDETGKWISDEKKVNTAAEGLFKNKIVLELKKHSDSTGEYYIHPKQDTASRAVARKKCAPDSTESEWADFFILEK
jgi:hypothetical protein